MMETEPAAQDCKFNVNPSGSRSKQVANFSKIKGSFKSHNPFGGRRMIFTSCASPTDDKHKTNYKNGKNMETLSKILSGDIDKSNLVKEKSVSSQAKHWKSSKSNGVFCDDEIEDIQGRENEAEQLSAKKSNTLKDSRDILNGRRCRSYCRHGNVTQGKGDNLERDDVQSKHKLAQARNITSSRLEHRDNPSHDVQSEVHSAQGIDQTHTNVDLNFITGLMKTREPHSRSDKYTIVFTKERHQKIVPDKSSPSVGQDRHDHQSDRDHQDHQSDRNHQDHQSDREHQDHQSDRDHQDHQSDQDHQDHQPDDNPMNPTLQSDTLEDLKAKHRKFVIRREKHEAASGRAEDATYTIHVSSQLLGDSLQETTSNYETRKKETRGAIFRKTVSLRKDNQTYFRPAKTCVIENTARVRQRDQDTLRHIGRGNITRLSSLSPPRQNRNDAGSIRCRATSEHAGGNSTKKRPRRRPIRLIDHLEKREQTQIKQDEPDVELNLRNNAEHSKLQIEAGRHRNTRSRSREFVKDRENEIPWDLRHASLSCHDLATGDTNSHRYLSPQTYNKETILHVSTGKDKMSINVDKINSEKQNAINTGEKRKCDALCASVEFSQINRQREENSHSACGVSKKDVACQYSPPTPRCCLCHCHTPDGQGQRSQSSCGRVRTERLVYHKIRNYYPARLAVRRRAKAQHKHCQASAIRKSGKEEENDGKNGEIVEEEDKDVQNDENRTEDEEQEKEEGDEQETSITSDNIESLQIIKRNVDINSKSLVFGALNESYEEEDGATIGSLRTRSSVSSWDSFTSSPGGCKNNSANRRAHRQNKRASNTFKEIVDQAKRRSSINVRPLDNNTNFQRLRETPVLDQTGQTEEAGHYFIGDYLLSLWKKQVLCDVRVNVNNSHFLAHKLVLAAFSDIFTPTTPYPEPTLQFNVPNASPESVYRVFKYIYTASMDVRDDQLEETLHVGIFLGIHEIKDVVREILSKPTLENVELYIEIQNRCGISASVMDYPHLYQNYLIQMISMEKFLQLTSEELEVILRDPNVLVETEVDTLHALAVWAQYNPLERMSEVPRLMDFIIFEVISPENIAKIIQMYDPIFSEMGSRNKISEVFRFHALRLSNKVERDKLECFVKNVPGISQDTLMDRVSYIPSQGALSKHLERPTLTKPSNPLQSKRSSVYSVRPSIKSAKYGQHLSEQLSKSFASNMDEKSIDFGRSSIKSQTQNTPRNANWNAIASPAKRREKRHAKIVDSSNNSDEKHQEELQTVTIEEKFKENKELCRHIEEKDAHSWHLNQFVKSEGHGEFIDRESHTVPSRRRHRLPRKELWTGTSNRLGSVGEMRHPQSSGNCLSHSEVKAVERTSNFSHQSHRLHPLWLSELQLSECQARRSCIPETRRREQEREQRTGQCCIPENSKCQRERELAFTELTETPSLSCCSMNPQTVRIEARGCSTRQSSQAKCNVSEYVDCYKEQDFLRGNKNSNASSFFELV